MPDCDQFARVVGRIGRAAVAAFERTLCDGAPMDNVVLAKLAESLWRCAGGVHCLKALLEITSQNSLPSIAISQASNVSGVDSTLDLVAVRATQRAILDGETAPSQIAFRVVHDAIQRHVVYAKGGLLERVGAKMTFAGGTAIKTAIETVARVASLRLAMNPNLSELRISSQFQESARTKTMMSEVLR